MTNRLLAIGFIVVSALTLSGCKNDVKTVYNQTYIETVSTQKGDIMIFKNEDGFKYGYILDPSDSFKVSKNKAYDLQISVETLFTSYGGFIKGVDENK
jgi:signal peptidase I